MEIKPSELFVLSAWFCGPATILTVAYESVLFYRTSFFRKRPVVALLAYLGTIILVPIGSLGLLLAGLGETPLISPINIERSSGAFMVPWFWQSFVAATIVGGVVCVVVMRTSTEGRTTENGLNG